MSSARRSRTRTVSSHRRRSRSAHADRAGSRLGEIATRSRASALKLQQRLANVQDARAFFPLVHDLPEFMSQAEFQRRFGGVGQPEYRRMIAQIEARIAGLVVYRK